MRITRKYFALLALGILLVFAGGIIAFSSLNENSAESILEKNDNPQESSATPQTRSLLKQFSEAFGEAAEKVSSSVVTIYAERVIQTRGSYGLPEDALRDFFGEDFLRRFFGTPSPREETRTSLGSGVIVTKDGYILTNNHVVEKAQKLRVVLNGDKAYEATVVGADPPTDVAVIKIKGEDFPAAKLGNSDECKIGQWVIAVGNPFSLAHTVTAGIISAKGRSSVGLADYEDFIQTDASINPGNSGGALADLEGNVVGINTAITSPSGGNIGIGFAIPINMARQVMEALLSEGRVIRGYLAILPQDVDEDLARALRLKSTKGSLVAEVTPGGPADKAGIRQGDFIVGIDGKKLEDTTQLRNIVAMNKPGTPVRIKLIRDEQEIQVSAVLAEQPTGQETYAPQPEQPREEAEKRLGLRVQTLTPGIAEQLGYQGEHGVIVVEVLLGSAAEEARLQRGDLIKEVNRREVRTGQDFEREMRSLDSGDVAALLVRRGSNSFFVAIKIP